MQGALALIKAQAALARGWPAHHRVFGHLDDDVWFSVNTTAYRRHATLRKILPSLPDAQTQKDFDVREFLHADGEWLWQNLIVAQKR